MKEVNDAPTCEYSNELISFVYSELTDKESQQFKLHLNSCRQCSAELDSFGEMRDAIGAWKYQSLAPVLSTDQEAHDLRPARKKSAAAALREFFDLSPLWMKGAVGLATVLFCVLAVIATGKLNQNRSSVPVVKTEKTYTQQEVDSLVAKTRAEAEAASQTNVVKYESPQENVTPKNVEKNRIVVPQLTRSKRPLSRAEREQLATDLRLTSLRNDDSVDLISDRINE
jgi:anti-sigma factor RsiW